MKRTVILLLILLATFGKSYAQISHGGRPVSFDYPALKKLALYSTPDFDHKTLLKEDEEAGRTKPFRYGITHPVSLNPENSGTWDTIANGIRIWQLKIHSKAAYSISLLFDNFELDQDVKLFVYSEDKNQLIGAFTSENNKTDKWFSTVPIAGEDIIIELDVPNGQDFGKLDISGIVHDYKNVFGFKAGFGTSGDCNVNINCSEGDDWQSEKRAVVKYSFTSGFSSYICTGALVNNTAFDGQPYVLTANHCISNDSEAATAVFWFNYESEGCVATVNPSYQSMSSADLISTGSDLDFSLLKLSDIPPLDYNVYYAGWNRKSVAASNTVTIHHPDGDIKKISVDNDAPVIDDFGEGFVYNSHWKINEWDVGTTEGGSSGCPLFDQNHLIVGDLTGGDAYCGNSINDYFARFDMSWDYHSGSEQQLKVWLDPISSGLETLPGFDPNEVSDGVDAAILLINSPSGTYCTSNEVIPEVLLQNKGTADLTSVTLCYQIDDGEIITKPWTGNLQTWENETVTFKPITIPVGSSIHKAYVKDPNGTTDENLLNDTATSSVTGHEPIAEVIIDGNAEICSDYMTSTFTTPNIGKYLWNATGGEIVDSDTLQSVEIDWSDWGERKIELSVTNYCDTYESEPVDIIVVEQSLEININIGSNGKSVCWNLIDCEGNTVMSECDLPSNSSYKTTLCVPVGCYQFIISSELQGVLDYSLKRLYDNKQLIAGSAVSGSESIDFVLNSTSGLANFNIYPIPSTTELVIEANFIELYDDATFALYNLNGSLVLPATLLDERKVINISTLPKGMYVVKIITSYGEFSKKIIKL